MAYAGYEKDGGLLEWTQLVSRSFGNKGSPLWPAQYREQILVCQIWLYATAKLASGSMLV